ncbi:hypothetical protein ACC806_34740 [Rhizobium ruizarguesonis]
MSDTSHLVALLTRLSHERQYLAVAKHPDEIALRKVWIAQIEKEIAAEEKHLGIEAIAPDDMSDEELLRELDLGGPRK